VAFLISVTYFEAMEWKDRLSFSSFYLVSTVCIDLFDSLSPPSLTNARGFSLLLLAGACGVAFLVSVIFLRRWNGRIGCLYGVVHFLFCFVSAVCILPRLTNADVFRLCCHDCLLCRLYYQDTAAWTKKA
jgi:hypothetical protein